MNATDRLPAGADLDKLLSAFFKSELPDPFPGLKAPAPRAEALPMPAVPRTPIARQPLLTKSRFSLAVSVALLLGGCWYLSGHISAPTARPNVGKNGEATLPNKLDPNKDQGDKKLRMMP